MTRTFSRMTMSPLAWLAPIAPNNKYLLSPAVTASVIVICIVYAGLCIPFDYAPLRDYSEWIFQAQIIDRLILGEHSPIFFIKEYPVPYSITELLLCAFLFVFSPFVVSKLFLGLYVFLALFVIFYWLYKRRTISPSASLFLIITVILNSAFWSGYISYQVALILFCTYLTVQDKTSVFNVMFFSIILFFGHGMIWVAFCLTTVIFSIYNRRIIPVIASLIPSVSLAVIYLLQDPAQTEEITTADPLINDTLSFIEYKGYTLEKTGAYQNLIVNYGGDQDISQWLPLTGLALNTIYGLALVIVLIWALYREFRRNRWLSPEIVAGCLLFIAFVISPSWAVGLLNPGARLLLPALVLFTPMLFHQTETRTAVGRFLIPIILATLPFTLLGIATLPEKALIPKATVQPALSGRGQILFGHDLTKFNSKIYETQRAWLASEIPVDRLYFQSGLISERNVR